MNFSLKNLVLIIIWSHEHTCHIIKTVFQMILQKNFQNSSKFLFLYNSTDRVSLSTNWKGKKKILDLIWNSWVASIPHSIPPDQSNLFLSVFRFLARFLSTDRNWKVFGFLFLDQSVFSCIIFVRIHMHYIVFFVHLAFL